MLQSQPQSTQLFRTSLRDWQANWKARQASRTEDSTAAPGETVPTRVKRLVAHKRRKQKRLAENHSQ